MDVGVTPIRLASVEDAGAIARLSRDTIEAGLPWRWQPAAIERFIESDHHNVIVAGFDALLGFAVMNYHEEDAYLALLAVAPDARRGGLARRLLSWLLKTGDVAGIATVKVDLREDNIAAWRLYEEAGFVEAGRKSGAYYGRVNQVSMRLALRPSEALP
jgi:[ribosomal protein S18]-alanine N-acetyltransferase